MGDFVHVAKKLGDKTSRLGDKTLRLLSPYLGYARKPSCGTSYRGLCSVDAVCEHECLSMIVAIYVYARKKSCETSPKTEGSCRHRYIYVLIKTLDERLVVLCYSLTSSTSSCTERTVNVSDIKMATQVQVHVVNKTNCSENHIVDTDPSLLPPLAPNNIRLQVRMASLTANNLTYARLASVANWWDGESLKCTPINPNLAILKKTQLSQSPPSSRPRTTTNPPTA